MELDLLIRYYVNEKYEKLRFSNTSSYVKETQIIKSPKVSF